ncbi:phosphatidate cytidylyltransferase [Bradyrhizobium sp. Tv2a-2]|uniref:phosphatidate cytidylyltransferase n=1 Tax=Bradyrhizobium sp. Tv2a-2 TaxID=113395 RepID=UPI000686797A|nr:phosphatidate cytidylyltransferase [Bradyrhizobium sp. Tv2a-2]
MRVLAAVVLVPLALGSAYIGGALWTALVTLAVIGLFIEWLMVVGAVQQRPAAAAGVVALVLAGAGLALVRFEFALVAAVAGLAAVAALSAQGRLWAVAGYLYAGAALFAAVLLRADQEMGFAALIFVLLVVWATDIGGYFAGRGIGGPKLWPRVSPNKTWAGAVGGFLGSLVVAAGFAAAGVGRIGPLLVLGGILSVAGQFGDLFESAVKRRFGVKDSSHIIPGHGGLLDRLDSLVAVLVLAAIFGFVRHGADGIGRGLMVW